MATRTKVHGDVIVRRRSPCSMRKSQPNLLLDGSRAIVSRHFGRNQSAESGRRSLEVTCPYFYIFFLHATWSTCSHRPGRVKATTRTRRIKVTIRSHVSPKGNQSRAGRITITSMWAIMWRPKLRDLETTWEEEQKMKCGFRSTFQGRDYSVWATDH